MRTLTYMGLLYYMFWLSVILIAIGAAEWVYNRWQERRQREMPRAEHERNLIPTRERELLGDDWRDNIWRRS